ncbi:sugar ABC transporter permease [Rhodobacterales bacterium 56_14_T64]|nr:sugar ABC transporter permease [Rhodobacterales bacterium 56_14_T64]
MLNEQTTQISAPKKAAKTEFDVIGFFAKFAPLIFLIVLIIAFGLANERFLSPRNISNILTEVSIFGLMSIGMTFVILTAGIDLSVGSTLALAGMMAAFVATGGNYEGAATDSATTWWGFAFLTAIGVGIAAGLLQGFTTNWFGVPPFVVTLGGMTIFRGITLLVGGGGPISGFDAGFRWWGRGDIFGVPVPVCLFGFFAVVAWVTLKHTKFGRNVFAVGANPEAARLSGINVKFVITAVYTITGFFAGLAAFVLAARLNSAEAVAGMSFELRVIASVVIGGTSLFGGIGGVAGTVVGALLIGVMMNGLVMLNVQSFWQQIVIGVIIVLAVAFDTYAKSRRSSA